MVNYIKSITGHIFKMFGFVFCKSFLVRTSNVYTASLLSPVNSVDKCIAKLT